MMTRMRPIDWCFVVALLLLAIALRFGGLTWGQPDLRLDGALAEKNLISENTPLHPDEFLFVQRPLWMRVKGQLNPEFFHNPSFLINLNFITYILTNTGQGQLIEEWEGVTARQQAPFPLYTIGRTFSALGGLLAVAGVYATARLISGRYAAVAAGMLAAVSFLLVQHAHYATTSSLSAGFSILVLWAVIRALKTPHQAGWGLAFAGVAAGLASGSRYNAVLAGVILLAAGVWLFYRWPSRRMLRAVTIGWLLLPLTFILTTPAIIFDTQYVLDQMAGIVKQYLDFWDVTFTTDYGLWFEYRYLVLFGLGIPGSLAVVTGIYAAIRQRQRGQVWSLVAVLLIALYIIPYSLIVLRTVRPISAEQLLIPILPHLIVIAGVGVEWIRTLNVFRSRIAFPMITLVLIGMPLTSSAQFVHLLNQPDTRQIMQEWVYTHLPVGSRLHLNGPYNVPLDHADYVWSQNYATQYPPVEEMLENGVDYVILSDAWYHDVLRSGEIINAEYLQEMRDYLAKLDNSFTRLAYIPRPQWPGSDSLMHTPSYWHNPGMIVYCVTEASCAAVR